MIPLDLMRLAAEKGMESWGLNPTAGDIPSFADKAFSEIGSESSDFEKDSDIPKFVDDSAETETHADADETDAPNGPEDGVASGDAPVIAGICYVNADDLLKYLPRADGCWTGEPGNSTWVPDSDYVPQKCNPEGKTWGEILGEHGIDGIPFDDGEPDFSEVAEAEVQVDEIGLERDENFAKADETLAEQWTKEQKDGHEWTAEDVRNYRKENHLTWHECGDRTTMQLVPAEVHSNVPHSGGVSAAKAELGKSEATESTSTTSIASDGTSNSNNVNKA